MTGTVLTVGAGRVDRRLDDTEELLVGYRTDDGLRYLYYEPASSPDLLVPDDLAVTILINSRVAAAAFKSVQDHGSELDLKSLPRKPLENPTPQERRKVAEVVAEMASWKGLAASVATKVLHKKRPDLIPVLDNQAIFGAYLNPRWPGERSSQESVYAVDRIEEALEGSPLISRVWKTRRDGNASRWSNPSAHGFNSSTWSGGPTFEGSSRSPDTQSRRCSTSSPSGRSGSSTSRG